ncbi:PAS domain-containing sensor histidine kinase [Flammeovirga aprica]|uniref:histidine kinase n=1 Tax=Flammeovirga aprica JL-4 TaxID=694437 RepID=A0A7X9RYA8_9BACT|nr:PAS domain S-box protein [Flammeovirga aprica]NME70910.1 PAS domain S-box protein [Flammeovirga aprica JL-4]
MNVFLQNDKKKIKTSTASIKDNHYLIINSNGNIKFISKGFLNGAHTFEENRSIAVGLSPKNQIVFKQKIYDALNTQDTVIFEFTISINSRPHLFKITLYPFFINEAFVNATFETVNKEKELHLKRFKDTYIHSVDAIIWIDPFSKDVIFSNPAFEKITGYSEKEILDKSFFMLIPESEKNKGKKEFSELRKNKSIVSDTVIITKKGNELPVEISANVVTSENDSPYIVCVLKDQTALAKAKKELKANSTRYEAVLDNSKIKICQFDLQLKLLWTGSSNDVVTSKFLTEKDYGLKIKEIINNESGINIHHFMNEAIKSKSTEFGSFPIMYDKEWKVVEIYFTPVIEKGKTVGLNAVFLNISDQKRIEDKLDHFVYRAAHDLRGPITTIQGLIQLIKDQDKENNYTNMLEETVWTQDMHLQKILAYYYNQKKELNVLPIDFDKITHQLNAFVGNSGYNICISTNNAIRKTIHSDGERILLLFKNICSTILQNVSRDIQVKVNIELKEIKNGIYLSFEDNVSPKDSFDSIHNRNGSTEYIHNDFSKGIFITTDIIEKLKGKYQVKYSKKRTQKLEILLPDLK